MPKANTKREELRAIVEVPFFGSIMDPMSEDLVSLLATCTVSEIEKNEMVAISYSCSAPKGGAPARTEAIACEHVHGFTEHGFTEHGFTEHEHGCRFAGGCAQ